MKIERRVVDVAAMARPAKNQPVVIDPEDPEVEDGGVLEDELEREQAAVGDLFAIQGDEFRDVSWSVFRIRTRVEIAAAADGQKEEWIADLSGELHGRDVQDALGGGTFRFRGYRPREDGRGVRLVYNKTIAIAGPRKNFATPSPSPPADVVTSDRNGLTRGERLILRAMQQQNQLVAQLIQAQQKPVEKAPSITEMVNAIGALDRMRGNGQTPSDSGMAKEMFAAMTNALTQGIALGQEREPLPAGEQGTDWGKVITETIAPIAARMFDRPAPPRVVRPAPSSPHAQPATPPPPTSGPASAAEVVSDPPVITQNDARWIVAISDLSQAVDEARDIEEAADDLERTLPSSDLSGVLAMSNEAVCQALVQRFGVQYPNLTTDRAREYVSNILDELRTAPDS